MFGHVGKVGCCCVHVLIYVPTGLSLLVEKCSGSSCIPTQLYSPVPTCWPGPVLCSLGAWGRCCLVRLVKQTTNSSLHIVMLS